MKKLLLLAMTLLTTTALFAQPNINASATIVSALTVDGQSNLAYGQILATASPQSIVVATTDANAGRFLVSGSNSATVNLNFSALPATLTGPAAATMAISYSGRYNTENAAGGSTFTPTEGSGPSAVTLDATTGQLYVYLGGTLTVGASQATGVYSATITLGATYN